MLRTALHHLQIHLLHRLFYFFHSSPKSVLFLHFPLIAFISSVFLFCSSFSCHQRLRFLSLTAYLSLLTFLALLVFLFGILFLLLVFIFSIFPSIVMSLVSSSPSPPHLCLHRLSLHSCPPPPYLYLPPFPSQFPSPPPFPSLFISFIPPPLVPSFLSLFLSYFCNFIYHKIGNIVVGRSTLRLLIFFVSVLIVFGLFLLSIFAGLKLFFMYALEALVAEIMVSLYTHTSTDVDKRQGHWKLHGGVTKWIPDEFSGGLCREVLQILFTEQMTTWV